MLPKAAILLISLNRFLFFRQALLMAVANQCAIWEHQLEEREEAVRKQVAEQWEPTLSAWSKKLDEAKADERLAILKDYGEAYKDYSATLCRRLDAGSTKKRQMQVWLNNELSYIVRRFWEPVEITPNLFGVEAEAGEMMEVAA